MAHFAALSEQEIESLIENKDAQSTQRVKKQALGAFSEYLTSIKASTDLESMAKADLCQRLRSFFANARRKDGTMFKKSTLHTIKYGLMRHLKDKLKIDINTDAEFQPMREVYAAVVTKLKRDGFGDVQHYPPITPADLNQLYSPKHHCFDTNTPVGLQQKVWFELMYYICRRGRENLRRMTKQTFSINTDSVGHRYVYQVVSEMDKNHRANAQPNETSGEGRMYEMTGNPVCPVKSYEKYLSKLHPRNEALWQRPGETFDSDSDIWFCNAALGKNSLSSMMPTICKSAKLSKSYTNHSIRATCITVLDDGGIEARHIMRVSGHKSEASIRSYSSRLSEKKQKEIAQTLSVAASLSTDVIDPSTISQQSYDDALDLIPDEDLLLLTSSQENFVMETVNKENPLPNNTNNHNAGGFQPVFNNCNVTMNFMNK